MLSRTSQRARHRCLMCLAVALVALLAVDVPSSAEPAPPADREPEYERDVAPLLKKHCYRCHGPDRQESGLRLDRRADALAGGDRGPSIVAGDAAESRLIRFISGEETDVIMPPEGDTLEAEAIDTLRRWIDAGAEWPESD